MCGIAGIIQKTQVNKELMGEMLKAISHRGPDDEGVWFGKNGNIALGHRRLSIIDLSPAGHQPMASPDGNFVVVYNGEIYNFQEIRDELEKKGHDFKSKSDTEVLLHSYMEWGEECLDRLNGMFAFAIWDEKEQKLFAARDRVGEKPFKYFFDGNKFIFASELKAILRDPEVKREIDWQAVDLAFTYRYVPSPLTGFKNIHKLPAGHKLVWQDNKISVTPYWQAREFAKENNDLSLEDWKIKAWDLFRDSVKKRMISDVPVGAFLSGGLDSSSVVAAMAEISSSPIKTFSVGFKDRPDSETPFAKLVADKFKTDHTEIIIDPKIVEILPKLIYQYEEPFFDNSAVPTMAMSEETKKHVSVVLSGDGGDECFGGYPNYAFFKYLNLYQSLPGFIYRKAIPGVLGFASRIIGSKKLKKLFYRSEILSHPLLQAYVDYYGIWQKELDKSRFYITKNDLYNEKLKKEIDLDLSEKVMGEWLSGGSETFGKMNRAMLSDIHSRLGDNYLVKIDFAGMLNALETRPPFLDHRLIELSLSLPEKYKIKNGDVKWIWKEIIKDKLPKEIIERKKMGFGIPIIAWMRNELFGYLKEELESNSVIYEYLNKSVVLRMLLDHKEGKADYSNHIWSVLLLKLWVKEFFNYDKK